MGSKINGLFLLLFNYRTYLINKKLVGLNGQNHPAIPTKTYAVPIVPLVQEKAKEPLRKTPGRTGTKGQKVYTPYNHLDTMEQTQQ
jgi:hypothetical protein